MKNAQEGNNLTGEPRGNGPETLHDGSPVERFYDQAHTYLELGILQDARVEADELEAHFERLLRTVAEHGEALGNFQLVIPDAIVPLQKQLEAVGGYGFIETSELRDTVQTPATPYLIAGVKYGFASAGERGVLEAKQVFSEEGSSGLVIGEVIAIAAQNAHLWKSDLRGMIATETFHPGWADKPDAYIDLYKLGQRFKIKRDIGTPDLADEDWVIPSCEARVN